MDCRSTTASQACLIITPRLCSMSATTCIMLAHLQVQRCTLLSIKTGGCPENCSYCSQSSHWSEDTGMKAEKLMDLEPVYEVSLVVAVNLKKYTTPSNPCASISCLSTGMSPGLIVLCTPPAALSAWQLPTVSCLSSQAALRAKESGSTRFCMGAAWRGPSQVGPRQWERVLEMVRRIRGLGMEVRHLCNQLIRSQAIA